MILGLLMHIKSSQAPEKDIVREQIIKKRSVSRLHLYLADGKFSILQAKHEISTIETSFKNCKTYKTQLRNAVHDQAKDTHDSSVSKIQF